jgi:4-aminobutyrate aminotransferase-like enzyme
VADEVLTGLGRTGRRFAVEAEAEVAPDLLLVGKSLAGGLPLAAAVGTPAAMESWRRPAGEALHTATFLGHPRACAAALAVLDVLEHEGLAARAAALGTSLLAGLAAALGADPGVAAIRGRGLLAGIELRDPATGAPDGRRAWQVTEELLARGVIVLPAGEHGEVIELAPPLTIAAAELEHGVATLAATLAALPAAGGSGPPSPAPPPAAPAGG